jgi:NAD+ synthase (glutamine-hydrolysing)
MPSDPIRPLTVALCQFAPRKGDVPANLARLGELCAQGAALSPRPQVIQFPETSLSGYFVEGGVREVAVTAGSLAYDLDESYRTACARAGFDAIPIDVVVGFYERWRDTLHNSSAYITIGLDDGPPVLRHVHRKNYLPTYGLFDEERFVERGIEIRAFEAPWGRAAMLVCEDAWHSLSGTIAALDGAQVVFVCSAAPARGVWPRNDGVPGPYSAARWERLIRDIAEEHGVYATCANLVDQRVASASSGRRCWWDRAVTCAAVRPCGMRVSSRSPSTSTISCARRADSPLLSDLRVSLPHVMEMVRRVHEGVPHTLQYDGDDPEAADIARAAKGFVTGEYEVPTLDEEDDEPAPPPRERDIPVIRLGMRDQGGPPSLDIDPVMTEQWLVGFLREEFERRGFTKAVVGLSGGVDSAVTSYLAARAFGPKNVVAVRMPYRTSSPDSLAHAQLVIDALGIDARTIDISVRWTGISRMNPMRAMVAGAT